MTSYSCLLRKIKLLRKQRGMKCRPILHVHKYQGLLLHPFRSTDINGKTTQSKFHTGLDGRTGAYASFSEEIIIIRTKVFR
jgi:hypothetical protein